eukprot:sb/3472774/
MNLGPDLPEPSLPEPQHLRELTKSYSVKPGGTPDPFSPSFCDPAAAPLQPPPLYPYRIQGGRPENITKSAGIEKRIEAKIGAVQRKKGRKSAKLSCPRCRFTAATEESLTLHIRANHPRPDRGVRSQINSSGVNTQSPISHQNTLSSGVKTEHVDVVKCEM